MTGLVCFRWRAVMLIAGIGALGGLVQMADRSAPPLLVNESPSLPRGLYVRQPGAGPDRQATVALPQPSSVRAYLGRIGMPPEVLLIKRVAALEGDRVCRTGDRIEVGHHQVRVVPLDRRGRLLPSWNGCRSLEPGEIFVLGDTGTSFDSRYFGPVKKDDITGVYREVLRW
jgi:conjugative transfer signal peptidase TraF